MNRLLLSACAAALMLSGASPALAQFVIPPAAPALPIALPPIPAPADKPYPGVIKLAVDATDLDRHIFQVRETIPVTSGPMTLLFPQWLPGNHSPSGPVANLAGLIITADGKRVEWIRDPANVLAYHIDVPAGATEIVAEFQHLSPINTAQGRVTMTREMLNVQWEKMLLYPAGYSSRNITLQPSLVIPEGWSLGTALETAASATPASTSFKPVNLEELIDSPVFAGKYYRLIDLDPNGRSPVRLNLVADNADALKATDDQIAILRSLVQQADRLYGARHYNHYDFLVAATDRLGGIGLEHSRSSENSIDPGFFTDYDNKLGDRDLLPHEYTHSWNGKWRRPADQLVPNFNTPLQNSLLWVYEGQTQYWGKVLAGRSGLHNRQQSLDALALTAATYDNRIGREWRAMQDTTNDPIINQRRPQPFGTWQRSEDYYEEGQLIWLDADTLIREKTNGRKSLDDFAKAFFGVEDGDYTPTPYTFEDVVRTLNDVVPYDWANFLRTRLDGHGETGTDGHGAPLDGLTRGGYRLIYTDTMTPYQKTLYKELGRNDFLYSLGFISNGTNVLGSVQWGGLAFQKGLVSGVQIIAVNGEAASPKVIADAVTAAKGGTTPIEMIVKDGERFRTIQFDYHDGLRYPRLERIPGTPDRLGDIYSARAR